MLITLSHRLNYTWTRGIPFKYQLSIQYQHTSRKETEDSSPEFWTPTIIPVLCQSFCFTFLDPGFLFVGDGWAFQKYTGQNVKTAIEVSPIFYSSYFIRVFRSRNATHTTQNNFPLYLHMFPLSASPVKLLFSSLIFFCSSFLRRNY